MKTHYFGIRALAVSLTLILFPLSLMAWQLGAPADDENPAIPPEEAVGLAEVISSEPPPAPRENPNEPAQLPESQNRFDSSEEGSADAELPSADGKLASPAKRELPGVNYGAQNEPNDASGLESGIARLAEELQSLNTRLESEVDSANPNRQTRERKERAIRQIVEQAFDMRQQLQRLETQRIRLRLDAIERNLAARENSRERIIQQRIEELLGQKIPPTRSGNSADAVPRPNYGGAPVTATPIGVPGPPHIPLSGPAELPNNVGVAANIGVQWQHSDRIVLLLRNAMSRVANFQDRLTSATRDVERWSQPLAELKSQGIATSEMNEADQQRKVRMANDSLPGIERDLELARRDLNHVWSNYQSQRRLFQLDVEEAQQNFESLATKHQRLEQLVERQVVPTSELEETTAALAIARIRLQRAEEILRNYAEIEKLEQELKPDSPRGQ